MLSINAISHDNEWYIMPILNIQLRSNSSWKSEITFAHFCFVGEEGAET